MHKLTKKKKRIWIQTWPSVHCSVTCRAAPGTGAGWGPWIWGAQVLFLSAGLSWNIAGQSCSCSSIILCRLQHGSWTCTGLSCNFILILLVFTGLCMRGQKLILVKGVYSLEKWTKPNPVMSTENRPVDISSKWIALSVSSHPQKARMYHKNIRSNCASFLFIHGKEIFKSLD